MNPAPSVATSRPSTSEKGQVPKPDLRGPHHLWRTTTHMKAEPPRRHGKMLSLRRSVLGESTSLAITEGGPHSRRGRRKSRGQAGSTLRRPGHLYAGEHHARECSDPRRKCTLATSEYSCQVLWLDLSARRKGSQERRQRIQSPNAGVEVMLPKGLTVLQRTGREAAASPALHVEIMSDITNKTPRNKNLARPCVLLLATV